MKPIKPESSRTPTETRRLARLLERAGRPCSFCDSRRVLSQGPCPICSIALPDREADGTGNLTEVDCYLAVLKPEDHARASASLRESATDSSGHPTAGFKPEQISLFA
jgi:hypothetical protein